MAEEWLTYSELGERLGVSPEAARQKSIRLRLRRQTANDGKAQVLVDLEEVKASVRKPKDQPSDNRPTPDEQPSDERVVDALEAHIATLKDMVAKAEAAFERERERADGERVRADSERARVDAERVRVDELLGRVESLMEERKRQAEVEEQVGSRVAELTALVEQMRRPWWRLFAR